MTSEIGGAPAGWIVRVVDGAPTRQSVLPRRDRITIGHALMNEIVLRDSAAKGRRVALELDPDLDSGRPARLQVLEGEVSLLGNVLAAPARALLPPYTPLSLGGIQLAYGEPDHPRWCEAERLARAARPETSVTAEGPVLASQADRRETLLRRTGLYLPLALGALALSFVLVGVNGGARGVAHASLPAKLPSPPTAAGLVARAEDMLMSSGVVAKVAADGRGGLSISVPGDADPLVVDTARRRLLRENPMLRQAGVVFNSTTQTSARRDGAAKRIVAAVGGADGYLMAADGSKYFQGAQLPSGQVLKSIDHNTIVFDQDGLTTQLNLQDGDAR